MGHKTRIMQELVDPFHPQPLKEIRQEADMAADRAKQLVHHPGRQMGSEHGTEGRAQRQGDLAHAKGGQDSRYHHVRPQWQCRRYSGPLRARSAGQGVARGLLPQCVSTFT